MKVSPKNLPTHEIIHTDLMQMYTEYKKNPENTTLNVLLKETITISQFF